MSHIPVCLLRKRNMSERIIIHLDMDAFFASVEQQCNPRLQGKPIAVTGRGSRTVVTTASYEARARGVKTGMNMFEARRCCPEIIFIQANNTRYTDTCAGFVALCCSFTPLVEVFSVDEVFLDITGSIKLFGSARSIVKKIKDRLSSKTGLTCSAGIAPNKLLAKVASNMEKPDGLVEIPRDDVPQFLEHLPVSKLCGIGSNLEQKLSLLGIRTCGELGKADPLLLRQRFGVIGDMLHDMGRGEDESPVVPLEKTPDPRSVGHSMTLSRDISSRDLLEFHLLRLSEMVGHRARQGGFSGRTVALTVRYRDFTTFTKQHSVPVPVSETREIYRVAKKILGSIRLQQAVRLLGVTLSNLVKTPHQLPLFPEKKRQQEITRVMDAVNNRFGDFTLTWGSLLLLDNQSGVISPAWRPGGIRKIEF